MAGDVDLLRPIEITIPGRPHLHLSRNTVNRVVTAGVGKRYKTFSDSRDYGYRGFL